MLFIPETALEEALVKAVKHPALTLDFHRLLLESDLMVMGTVTVSQTTPEGKFVAAPGSEFKLETAHKDGVRFLPVFTGLPRMQAFAQKECKYLSMNGRALFEMTRGAPVTINPGSEIGYDFTPAEIEQLIGAETPRVLEASTAQIPQPLVDALTTLFDQRGDILTAWMILAGPRGSDATPVVGVETTADFRAVAADIETMANAKLPGLVFDLQRIDRTNPTGLTDVLLQAIPFYPQRALRTLN